AGDADAAVLTAEARAFNTPLRVMRGASPVAACAEAGVKVDSPAIEVAAVKPAEDGRGWIWRLVNVTERSVETTFAAGAGAKWSECDLVENALEAEGDGALRFGPFEIKTLRVMD